MYFYYIYINFNDFYFILFFIYFEKIYLYIITLFILV